MNTSTTSPTRTTRRSAWQARSTRQVKTGVDVESCRDLRVAACDDVVGHAGLTGPELDRGGLNDWRTVQDFFRDSRLHSGTFVALLCRF